MKLTRIGFIHPGESSRTLDARQGGGAVAHRVLLSTCITVLLVSAAGAQNSSSAKQGAAKSSAGAAKAETAKSVLEKAAKAMGAPDLKSIQYSGSGLNFAVGQSVQPGASWPKFNVKSYSRLINYETVSSKEELLRTQGENPPKGGGGQPLAGEQRQILFVSGSHAWNLAGNNAAPAPAALPERLLQIWMTPHGFLRAATASNATVVSRVVGGKRVDVVSFSGHGKYKVNGTIDDKGLVQSVESWLANPVLGDMHVEQQYSEYKDFDGVMFPTRIVQTQGGFPAMDLTISSVQKNAAADLQPPDSVKQAAAPPVRVESQKLSDGVWYLTGGSHHSALIEFKDHVAVIEAPLNEQRSLALIEEVKKLVPSKPIRYLINTHHHFDHSGGIRTFAAQGATIITHELHKPFYERLSKTNRTLDPDLLSKEKGRMKVETVAAKRVLTDGTMTVEIHHIKGNAHNNGILMAYLPGQKILIEADVFTPPAPNAQPPAQPNPFSVNLYENLQRLQLKVDQIAPLHGRLVTIGDLEKAIGKGR